MHRIGPVFSQSAALLASGAVTVVGSLNGLTERAGLRDISAVPEKEHSAQVDP